MRAKRLNDKSNSENVVDEEAEQMEIALQKKKAALDFEAE